MTIVDQAGKRQANRDHERRYGTVDELRLSEMMSRAFAT